MADSANAVFATSSLAYSRPRLAIGVGGLIVGMLDLLYAIMVYNPRHPILIPQTIALGAAAVYYLASRKLTFMLRRAILFGMLYGAAVYLFMRFVVLPLSAVPSGHTPLAYAAAEFVEHWFCVGLPIALSVRHYSS
jgi:hypothetical protein